MALCRWCSNNLLKKLINDAQEYLGEEITEAVVTVPADFNDNERKATIDACKICGIKLNKIIKVGQFQLPYFFHIFIKIFIFI